MLLVSLKNVLMTKEFIFQNLKSSLQAYTKHFTVSKDTEVEYELVANVETEIAGRERDQVPFITIIIQKSYVGFYFMPIYTHTELKKEISKELLRLLKGKSCFHIKSWDESLEKELKELIRKGFHIYKKNGWIEN